MNNLIDSSVIIQGDVELGADNNILPYTVLNGPLRIGNGNVIGPHVAIGTPGATTRDPLYDCSNCRIEIGDNNIIREFSAIQKPYYKTATSIGSNCFIMQSVNIPHDVVIHNDVVITPMVAMGGLVTIMQGANLAVSSSVHQYSVIGAYSIVGMGAAVLKNIRPFSRYIPQKPISVNHYAIHKFGFLSELAEIEHYVMTGEFSSHSKITPIIEEFEKLHLESKRRIYIET